MPVVFDGNVIKDGDTVKVGEKTYTLNGDGTMEMELAVPVRKIYSLDALIAKKTQLEGELAEVNLLITKHGELSGA